MNMLRRITALLLGMVLLLSGCAAATQTQGTQLNFYYAMASTQTDGAAIGSEMDRIDAVTVPDVLQRLLDDAPYASDLADTFPEGTVLQDWSLTEGVLRIDLSEEFSRLSGLSMTVAEYCLVLTLTQIEGVDAVVITANGQRLPGAAANALRAEDAVLQGETEDPITYGCQIYFPLSDRTGLGVEYVELTVASAQTLDVANAVLQQLNDGPQDEELSAFLDGNSQLKATAVRQGVCTVSVDNVALEKICQPMEDFQLKLYAIVDSLTEIEGVDSVRFLLNGAQIAGWQTGYTAVYEF